MQCFQLEMADPRSAHEQPWCEPPQQQSTDQHGQNSGKDELLSQFHAMRIRLSALAPALATAPKRQHQAHNNGKDHLP